MHGACRTRVDPQFDAVACISIRRTRFHGRGPPPHGQQHRQTVAVPAQSHLTEVRNAVVHGQKRQPSSLVQRQQTPPLLPGRTGTGRNTDPVIEQQTGRNNLRHVQSAAVPGHSPPGVTVPQVPPVRPRSTSVDTDNRSSIIPFRTHSEPAGCSSRRFSAFRRFGIFLLPENSRVPVCPPKS